LVKHLNVTSSKDLAKHEAQVFVRVAEYRNNKQSPIITVAAYAWEIIETSKQAHLGNYQAIEGLIKRIIDKQF